MKTPTWSLMGFDLKLTACQEGVCTTELLRHWCPTLMLMTFSLCENVTPNVKTDYINNGLLVISFLVVTGTTISGRIPLGCQVTTEPTGNWYSRCQSRSVSKRAFSVQSLKLAFWIKIKYFKCVKKPEHAWIVFILMFKN